MLTRNEYPAGVPCWIDVSTPDPASMMRFYGGGFGWEFTDRTPAGSPEPYCVAQLDGMDVAGIGAAVDGLPPESAWHTYITVPSDDEAAARVTSAGGGSSASPPTCREPGAGIISLLVFPTTALRLRRRSEERAALPDSGMA